MSHFSVLVVGDDVEAALEPYDENRETERFLRHTREQLIAKGRAEIEAYRTTTYATYLADPVAYAETVSNPGHLDYLAREFPARLTWTDEQVYAEQIRWIDPADLDADGAEWSDSNPQGYWDYWRVGGRWAGHLPLRNGRSGTMQPLEWEWDEVPVDERPDPAHRADSARKGDVNLEALEPTLAIVHDGQWIARGEMGWFGMMRSTEVSTEEWPQKWHKLVLALPDDTLLTVVDCHV